MKLLIIGATSAIAAAVAEHYAKAENHFYLIARNGEKLAALRERLRQPGAGAVETAEADLTRFEQHADLLQAAFTALGNVDLVLIAHGMLPDQARCEADAQAVLAALEVNTLSVVSLLTELAPKMREQGCGTLAVITSVAGDRGRPSNYVYGSAKALVSAYLQGLRGKLHVRGVHVIDIRPGLVDSPMTAHLPKGPLFATPERVAAAIVRGVAKKRHTVYAPGWWRIILFVVRILPDALFKRLNL